MDPRTLRRTGPSPYEALLTRAILDIAAEPERAGSHARPEIADAARTYHLRHSRDHVSAAIGRCATRVISSCTGSPAMVALRSGGCSTTPWT